MKTHPFLSSLSLLVFLFSLSGCEKMYKNQIEKSLKENPQLIFDLIKDNPSQFFETVRNASMAMNKKRREDSAKTKSETLQKTIDQGFNNPKKPDLSKKRAFFGEKNAPIVIVEYSDFQCPFCKRGAETMSRVLANYKGKVKIIYKHFPIKPMGLPASKYYEAIALQSPKKAQLFHDKIFENQIALSREQEEFLKKTVKNIGGLNAKKLEKDMKSEKIMSLIDADKAEAQKFGITGTPSFIINGSLIQGAYPYNDVKQVIEAHLNKKNDKK